MVYTLPSALAPLASYRQFILVHFVPVPGAPGKTEKFPCDYRTGRMTPKDSGGAHNPEFWSDWQTIANVAALMGDMYGVGFVITARDNIVCLDMDSCATPNGWTPEALAMMQAFPGAVELSNSGQGVHVWGTYQGISPPHGKKSKGTLNRSWLELYTELRFIALGSTATGTMYDLTAILPGFIAQYFPYNPDQDDSDEWATEPVPEYLHLDDDDLIARAMSQQRKQNAASVFAGGPPLPSFADLWTRNLDVLRLAYPPQSPGKEINASDADWHLAKELAYWTGKNHERVRRLMNMSMLKRDKWDVSKHRTYLKETVQRGVGACQNVHKAKPTLKIEQAAPGRIAPVVLSRDEWVSRDGMLAIFEGCVYVQDLNAVLLSTGDIIDQSRFKVRYAGYQFNMDNESRKTSLDAWEVFIHNRIIGFPRVEGTVFNPAREFQTTLEHRGRLWINVYKEPTIDREPGDVTPFMNLLRKLFPKGDDAIILLSYMAACCQYPGVKFKWAPFIQGTQGNGKSTIVKCLRHALGHKYIFSVKASMIENDFNSWLENNVLYVADDIYSTTDRANMMEALKSLITEEEQPITLKGVDSVQKSIVGNFIFTDNHKDAMKKQDDSRRICTLYCAQQSHFDRVRDGLTKQFFATEFIPWLEGGGFAHVAEMLHTMVIDPRYNPGGECKEAPATSATLEAIIDGRTGIEHEVAELIELNEPGFCGDFVSVHMLKRKLGTMPQYSKSLSPLKIKEMLGRLGYEEHGRTLVDVQPDDTRPILYVKRGNPVQQLQDVATIYATAQQASINASAQKWLSKGGV